MLRAVLDVNVIVSAFLSPAGTPASLLRSWSQGYFELVSSPLLVAELKRTLAYPKLQKRITLDEARRLIDWLESFATIVADAQDPPPVRSPDPGDDYLITLGAHARAILVTGDEDLLGLKRDIPVLSPASFLSLIEQERGDET